MDQRSDFLRLDTRVTYVHFWLHEQLELERIERDKALSLAKELAGRAVAPLEPLKEAASTQQEKSCS